MNHEQFQDMLDELTGQSGVGQEVLGDVLARASLRARRRRPGWRSRRATPPPAAPLTSVPSRRAPSARP